MLFCGLYGPLFWYCDTEGIAPCCPGVMSSSGFTPWNRVIYLALLVSLLGLTATGLPLKYSTQRWAHVYVHALGGFEYTSFIHHIFGIITLMCCVAT